MTVLCIVFNSFQADHFLIKNLNLQLNTPQVSSEKDSEMYVALYADETIPYSEIVKVLNIANENQFKMVLATRRPDKK